MLMTIGLEMRKRCVGMLFKTWNMGGIEVEGYLRKASAEELKDYQRYYLAFEECEKYYYVTYKKVENQIKSYILTKEVY